MSSDPNSAPKLGDRLRDVARQLRQEEQVQIQATSRILGAAAQLAQNNDRLVEEVVEMVTEDLSQAPPPERYTAANLEQQFDSFKAAKEHFGLKAGGWKNLAEKLNALPPEPTETSAPLPAQPIQQNSPQPSTNPRLTAIEQELRAMRTDLNRLLQLVEQLVQQSL